MHNIESDEQEQSLGSCRYHNYDVYDGLNWTELNSTIAFVFAMSIVAAADRIWASVLDSVALSVAITQVKPQSMSMSLNLRRYILNIWELHELPNLAKAQLAFEGAQA